MKSNDDTIVVEIEISVNLLKKDVEAVEVMDEATLLINGRRFSIREVMAGLLKLGNEMEAVIDSMRASRLMGEHDWFDSDGEGQ